MTLISVLFIFGAFVLYFDAAVRLLPKLPETDERQYQLPFNGG